MPLLVLLALLGLPAWGLAAGDVEAGVTGDGVLDVRGDDAANVVRIAAGGAPAAVVVSGLEGTTINGGAGPVTLSGVLGVLLRTEDGDDRVELVRLDLADRLRARLGRGRDGLILQDVRLPGESRIDGNADADDVIVRGFSRFRERLTVRTGGGADTITVTNAGFKGLRLETGGDADVVVVDFAALESADGELRIRTGSGNDDVSLLGSHFAGRVDLNLGGQNDHLLVRGSDFAGEVRADGRRGDDVLDLEGANAFPSDQPRVVRFESVR